VSDDNRDARAFTEAYGKLVDDMMRDVMRWYTTMGVYPCNCCGDAEEDEDE